MTGRCGKGFYYVGWRKMKLNNRRLIANFKSILKELLKYKSRLRKKAVLFIMQSFEWSSFQFELFRNVIEELYQSNVYVFVGHFENKVNVANKGAPWKLKNGILKNGTE